MKANALKLACLCYVLLLASADSAGQLAHARRLDECSALITATSAPTSIVVDAEDMLLIQPTSGTTYTNNMQATWSFQTISSTTYGVFVELLQLQSERSFDELVITGRPVDSSSSTSVTLSGTSSSFTSRLYTSGVSLSWTSDGSIVSGVGFRVRVTRVVIPGRFSPSSSLSGNILIREYATTLHNGGQSSKSLTVSSGREVALQATTTSAYIGGMNVAWVMAPPLASQTLKVDILNVDMRSADSVTLSTSSWSLTLSGTGVPSVRTYYVRGPLTVRMMTIAGTHVGTFDVRVLASSTQPSVGSGAVDAPSTCGGTGGSLPSGSSGGGGGLTPSPTASPSSGGGGTSSSVDDSPLSSIGAVVGTIFPIMIAITVASIAYRYYRRRQAMRQAENTAARTTNTGGGSGGGVQLNASSFAMGTATTSPMASAPAPASSTPGASAHTVSPYPGAATTSSYGAPPSSPGGYPGAPAGGSAPGYPYAPAYPTENSGGGGAPPPAYGAYPGVAPGMASSVAPYSTGGGAYPPAGSAPPAYGSAPPAYGSAPPAYGSAPGSPPGSSAYPGAAPGSSAYPGM